MPGGHAQPSPAAEAQHEVLAFLADPDSHGAGVARVERLETHAAFVFLAGDQAFKIKRAVRYPYLDFTTLEKREWACRRELRLNRRTAPALYLGVQPIVRGADGRLALGGEGEAVEWAVRMRRFPQEALFDHLARKGALSLPLCRSLAERIAVFHAAATPRHRCASIEEAGGQYAVATGNIAALRSRPDIFPAGVVETLDRAFEAHLAARGPLLRRRQNEGFLRHCHGDLHLRNICLYEGAPTLFDCLEFDDDLATIDVLYDLAFLLMDMEEYGQEKGANFLLNRYLEITGEAEGLTCLPLFLAQRAAVRAKVAGDAEALAARADRGAALAREASDYLSSALAYLSPAPPVLVCVGGLSGSGKTRLAHALAPHFGAPPGAVHLRSDQIRKALCGQAEETRLPAECYRPAVSARVYREMLEKAGALLRAGRAVLLDAVFNRPADRAAAQNLAKAEAVPFLGLWLEAPYQTLADRVAARRHDASDATLDVVRRQLQQNPGKMDWQQVDAEGDAESVAAAALAVLDTAGLIRPDPSDPISDRSSSI